MTMYKVRCSPDCPFPWCVILTDVPPEQQSQGGKEQEQNSDSDNSNDNSDSSSPITQSGDGNDSAESQSPSSGNTSKVPQKSKSSQSSSQGNDSGNGQDSGLPERSDRPAGDTKPEQSKPDSGDSKRDSGNNPKEKPSPKQPEKQPKSGSDKGRDNKDQSRFDRLSEHQPDQKPQRYQPVKLPDYKSVFNPDTDVPDEVFESGKQASTTGTGLDAPGRHSERMAVLTDAVFQARLRSVMKDNAYDRRVKGRKRGRLDMKSLYKIPARAENVFTLKEARKNKHYNVLMLVDQSGSMFGPTNDQYQAIANKYHNSDIDYNEYHRQVNALPKVIDQAAEICTFLAKALDKVDVKYGVIGFDTEHIYHKKLEAEATDDTLKKLNYDLRNTGGGGTALFKPLHSAYQILKRTPDHKNIVIVISDGQPGDRDEVVREVKANHHVADFIDVGVGSKPVTSHGFRVNNIEELKPLLVHELKTKIKRG